MPTILIFKGKVVETHLTDFHTLDLRGRGDAKEEKDYPILLAFFNKTIRRIFDCLVEKSV